MKVTVLGIIFALKNVGSWLASYTFSGIRADPYQFAYSLFIFVLVTTPSDLVLLNHLSNNKKEKTPDE